MGRLQDVLEGKKRKPSKGAAAAALITGAAVGATAGVLLAPKSGRETRDHLKLKAKEGVAKSKSKMREAKHSAKDKADQAVDTAKTAAEEGKQAAKEAKENTNRNSARR